MGGIPEWVCKKVNWGSRWHLGELTTNQGAGLAADNEMPPTCAGVNLRRTFQSASTHLLPTPPPKPGIDSIWSVFTINLWDTLWESALQAAEVGVGFLGMQQTLLSVSLQLRGWAGPLQSPGNLVWFWYYSSRIKNSIRLTNPPYFVTCPGQIQAKSYYDNNGHSEMTLPKQ